MQLPQIVKEFIKRLIRVCPSVTEVWAYGSHVNGEVRPDSDWDILVLGDSSVYKCVAKEWSNPPRGIDILVQNDENHLSAPWIEEGYSIRKSLSFTDLQWELDPDDTGCAKYLAKKDLPDGKIKTRWEKAIRIYPEIDY